MSSKAAKKGTSSKKAPAKKAAAKPKPAKKAASTSKAKAAAGTKATAKPKSGAASKTKAKAAPKPKSGAASKSKAKAAPKPKSGAASKAKAKAEAKAAPKSKSGVASKAKAPSKAKSGAASKSKAPSKAKSSAASKSKAKAKAKVASKPKSAPKPAPKKSESSSSSRKPKGADFRQNEYVVYPAHGVGKINKVEKRDVDGEEVALYVIGFDKDKMTLRVPVSKALEIGMRRLSSPKTISKAIGIIKGRARIKRAMWSRRAQEYDQKINSGDIIAIAEVVRDLHRTDDQREQSYSERQLYESALDRLTREVAAVGSGEEAAIKRIEDALSTRTSRS